MWFFDSSFPLVSSTKDSTLSINGDLYSTLKRKLASFYFENSDSRIKLKDISMTSHQEDVPKHAPFNKLIYEAHVLKACSELSIVNVMIVDPYPKS